MIFNPNQPERTAPERDDISLAKELGLEPDPSCNINTPEGKKAWDELQAELAKEAEEEEREQAEYDKGVADGSIEPEPDDYEGEDEDV